MVPPCNPEVSLEVLKLLSLEGRRFLEFGRSSKLSLSP
jgi:hypothetical protein